MWPGCVRSASSLPLVWTLMYRFGKWQAAGKLVPKAKAGIIAGWNWLVCGLLTLQNSWKLKKKKKNENSLFTREVSTYSSDWSAPNLSHAPLGKITLIDLLSLYRLCHTCIVAKATTHRCLISRPLTPLISRGWGLQNGPDTDSGMFLSLEIFCKRRMKKLLLFLYTVWCCS